MNDATPDGKTLGLDRSDQLYTVLDEFTTATLERVHTESNAQFIVEVVATSDPNVTTLFLRESIVIMASEQIASTASVDQWDAIANRFAALIDVAAECYAAPLAGV